MTGISNRSWTLLAVEGKRQYGGNAGYDDSPSSTYRFDSSVANSRHVKSGDLAFIRNRDGLLGIACIEHVGSEPGEKELLRCPVCRRTGIHERRTRTPLYRCNDGHEFDEPVREIIQVTKYEAHYGGTFVHVDAAISRSDLRSAALKTNDQMSIEEIDATKIADAVVRVSEDARILLETFFQRLLPDGEEPAVGEDGYIPRMADRRDRVLRSICARRGQAKFRNALIKRYGSACVISGCSVMAIVEAAHLWPYRGDEDNHPQNGLLLRSDLHTLFDLDLLGIDASSRVRVGRELKGSEYEVFDGALLKPAARPSDAAIALRWKSFMERQLITPAVT